MTDIDRKIEANLFAYDIGYLCMDNVRMFVIFKWEDMEKARLFKNTYPEYKVKVSNQ